MNSSKEKRRTQVSGGGGWCGQSNRVHHNSSSLASSSSEETSYYSRLHHENSSGSSNDDDDNEMAHDCHLTSSSSSGGGRKRSCRPVIPSHRNELIDANVAVSVISLSCQAAARLARRNLGNDQGRARTRTRTRTKSTRWPPSNDQNHNPATTATTNNLTSLVLLLSLLLSLFPSLSVQSTSTSTPAAATRADASLLIKWNSGQQPPTRTIAQPNERGSSSVSRAHEHAEADDDERHLETVNFAQNFSSPGTQAQHRQHQPVRNPQIYTSETRKSKRNSGQSSELPDEPAATTTTDNLLPQRPAVSKELKRTSEFQVPPEQQQQLQQFDNRTTFVVDSKQMSIRRAPVWSAQSLVVVPASSIEQSLQQQAAAQAAARALQAAQEDKRQANKLNTELCRNFSIGLQHEKGGVFTSPNYPNPYPVDLTCTRLIEAPLGHFIVVEFRDQFNIEEAGDDCDNDKIEIRDGRFGYSKVLARYCGNKFPPEVRSTNEAMWLRFISDTSITHNGFKAVYRFERQKNVKPNPPFECRFNVTSMPTLPSVNGTENRTGIHSGIIRNTDVPEKLLNYTKEYNVSLECIWNITVTPGWKIYLTFSMYDISKPNDCESNFIEIYEENLTEENQTVKFCGTRTEPQQSRSNVFNIRHHATPTAFGSKFEMIYTAFRDKGPLGCDSMEFDCDDGTCIHDSLKCDGIINCKYRYDEASDPGPCQSNGDAPPFFETEHMVIILIVFLTLVGGMCASIVISCWGKIQERRRRKLEYHIRKSREASMEGQMNKVDQLYSQSSDDCGGGGAGGNGGSTAPTSTTPAATRSTLKQRSVGKLMNNANKRQFTNDSMDVSVGLDNNGLDAQRLLNGARLDTGENMLQNIGGLRYRQHPLLGQMMISNDSFTTSGHQLLAGNGATSNSSLDTKGLEGQQHLLHQTAGVPMGIYGQLPQQHMGSSNQDVFMLDKSNQNSQNSFLASLAAAAAQQSNAPRDLKFAQDLQQQQLLNSTLIKNQMARQQQQQQHLIRGQSVGQANHQTMPMNLAKFNLIQQRSMLPNRLPSSSSSMQQPTTTTIGQAAFRGGNYGQRALTLSAMHRPMFNNNSTNDGNIQTIYGFNTMNKQTDPNQQRPIGLNQHLSTSITCCNGLSDCLSGETPLLSDLVSRVNFVGGGGQQQARVMQMLQQQQQQQGDAGNSRLATGSNIATMPRSMSAYQLSKAKQLRQQHLQQQQFQLHEQQQQQQQHLARSQQQNPMSYKSMSDAGHANKHQPPNHSISYPHACKGSHLVDQPTLANDSPSLPPPPPPPNLNRGSSGAQLLQQQQGDMKRAAFKMSRLDSSQLTGDTLPDSDLVIQQQQQHQQQGAAGLHHQIGSMQFDDPSTESTDATFGMLMNSIGNVSSNQLIGGVGSIQQQQQHQLRLQQQQSSSIGSQQQQQQQQQQTPLLLSQNYLIKNIPIQQQQLVTHLSDCNFIQRNRANNNQLFICDCGAMNQQSIYQQQRQQQFLPNQSADFDLDSDEAACMLQADGQIVGLAPGHNLMNGPLYNQATQQQRLAYNNRFRQQSSELTGDDDDDGVVDDDDEEEDDEERGRNDDNNGDDVEIDDDEDDDDDAQNEREFVGMNGIVRSSCNEEALKDAPVKKRHLSGSHTSISCKSCTCGSQTQLNIGNTNSIREFNADAVKSSTSSSDKNNGKNLKIYNDSSATTSDQGSNLNNNCDIKTNAQQVQQLN